MNPIERLTRLLFRGKLEEKLHLTQFAMDNAAVGIFWITPDGRFLYANEASARNLGMTNDELKGKAVWDVDPDHPRGKREEFWERLKRVKVTTFETRYRRKSGEIIPMEVTSQYLKFGYNESELTFARDIADRKKREEEEIKLSKEKGRKEAEQDKAEELGRAYGDLKNTQDQLVQAEKMAGIGTMAAGIAHELNNPLAGIMALMRVYKKTTAPERMGELEKINEALEYMARIIRDLNRFARKPTGERIAVDLRAAVERALTLAVGKMKRQKIIVLRENGGGVPPVMADPVELQQVAMNLVNNAMDAMPDGGEVRIGLYTAGEGGTVRLEVTDTGEGIKEEHLARIFEPFFTTREPGEGVGLGLSITYSIVKSYGGELRAENVPGGGARFTVELPAAKGGQEKETKVE